jgi:hypothetical protein
MCSVIISVNTDNTEGDEVQVTGTVKSFESARHRRILLFPDQIPHKQACVGHPIVGYFMSSQEAVVWGTPLLAISCHRRKRLCGPPARVPLYREITTLRMCGPKLPSRNAKSISGTKAHTRKASLS